MLGSGWYVADWTLFGFPSFFVVDASLGPGAEIRLVISWQLFEDRLVCVPVNPCHQMMVIFFGSKSGRSLCCSLLKKSSFQLPPRVLDADLSFKEKLAGWSVPSGELLNIPLPFKQVGNAGCHGATNDIRYCLCCRWSCTSVQACSKCWSWSVGQVW